MVRRMMMGIEVTTFIIRKAIVIIGLNYETFNTRFPDLVQFYVQKLILAIYFKE